jgi:protein-tyrosine phosphatase
MIDLHSHLLPGVDDGARTAEQALDALRMLAGHGVTDVVCTPHLRASDIPRSGAQAVARRDAVLAELRAAGPATPALHAGFEVLLDQPPTPLMVGNRQFALADSPYYLVEFRLSVVAHLATRILSEMARAGVIPLIAHVERYGASSPAVIAGWREAGARIQVDATTLTRPTSRGR